MEEKLDRISIEQFKNIIKTLDTSMDDYLYIMDLQNDYYCISKNAAVRFLLPSTEFRNVTENLKKVILPEDMPIVLEDIALIKEGKKHQLKYQSKKFFDFFSKWYAKDGILTLICEDIKWTTSTKDNRIYNELKTKAMNNSLNLIINKTSLTTDATNAALVSELERLGANVYNAPSSLVGTFSFSSLSKMNNNSIVIVRKKTDDKEDKVIFRDINNIYVTELLNSLINTLK